MINKLSTLIGITFATFFTTFCNTVSADSNRPNILWISAEDMSPTLGCYGDTYAHTPYLDALAKESVVYDKAFAASPVCAPSRSCLITGIHPATTGTGHMRSAFPLPEGVRGFPAYLRDVGYFTTNNVKTDYNNGDASRLIEESWNESSETASWRNPRRAGDQPFFAVHNLMESHQSRTMVWPYESFQEHIQSQLDPAHVSDPEAAPVPPYYPDTPIVRREIARFYDCVSVMDQKVGGVLAQLEEDGLAEDTIVVFFSDHGNGMPRHKRLLHDSGMRVALMVRFPEKYQYLAPSPPGTRSDRLVSFVDFAPTMLGSVGIQAPTYMKGLPFFGPESDKERKVVYGSRDRVDEVFDAARSVRTGRWLYLRNYAPHLGYHQPTVFPDLGVVRGEFPTEAADHHPALAHYIAPHRPLEELYDCEADPLNLNNLATENTEVLEEMRAFYQEQRAEHCDVLGIPEGEMWNLVRDENTPLGDILAGKSEHQPDLASTWKAADLVGTATKAELITALRSASPIDRYWAIIGLRHLHQGEEKIPAEVIDHLLDTSPDVRIEAASYLCQNPATRPDALQVLIQDIEHKDWWVALRACRAIELLGTRAAPALPPMRVLYDRCRHAPGDQHFFLAFSSGAFLETMGEETTPWDFTPGAASMFADPDEEE